eukprot:11342498-Alexandrium_andersonii.AAC.1
MGAGLPGAAAEVSGRGWGAGSGAKSGCGCSCGTCRGCRCGCSVSEVYVRVWRCQRRRQLWSR